MYGGSFNLHVFPEVQENNNYEESFHNLNMPPLNSKSTEKRLQK